MKAAKNAGKTNREHYILEKVRGTKDQPTDQVAYPDIFDPCFFDFDP